MRTQQVSAGAEPPVRNLRVEGIIAVGDVTLTA
jgi:hypothetical protein